MRFTEKEILMMKVNDVIQSRIHNGSDLDCELGRKAVIYLINRDVGKIIGIDYDSLTRRI